MAVILNSAVLPSVMDALLGSAVTSGGITSAATVKAAVLLVTELALLVTIQR